MSHDHSAPPAPPPLTVDGPPPPPAPPEVKSSKLITTLAAFGAVAGLLIVIVFQWAQPKIEAHQAETIRDAIGEVLAHPQGVHSVFVYKGALVDSVPAGVDTTGLDKIYAGTDGDGRLKGYALTWAEPGFSDNVSVIFGYDPASQKLLGMKVLEQKETPGLGDKIVKDSAFVKGFAGALSPIKGIKRGTARTDEHQVDMITGATISSRAVITTINTRLEKLGPLIKAYRSGGAR